MVASILLAAAGAAVATRTLDAVLDSRRPPLPDLAVRPLLNLTAFLKREHDMIGLGDTDHRRVPHQALVFNPRFANGLSHQGFADFFLEQNTDLQDSLDAISYGRESSSHIKKLENAANNIWLWPHDRRLLTAQLVASVRSSRLNFHAVDMAHRNLKEEMTLFRFGAVFAIAVPILTANLFFPRNPLTNYIGLPLCRGFGAVDPGFKGLFLNDRLTATKIRERAHGAMDTIWREEERNKKGPGIIFFNAEHFTNHAAQFGVVNLPDALRERGFKPVVVNMFSHSKQRGKFHKEYGKRIPGYVPAPIDYIVGPSEDKTLVVFNDAKMEKDYLATRPGVPTAVFDMAPAR